ncbi:MAG TPA: endolytic transglycosylase MltG [Solimonas sp.]|nr:endolytic transglycosylase MltG [Solimonas sp.]
MARLLKLLFLGLLIVAAAGLDAQRQLQSPLRLSEPTVFEIRAGTAFAVALRDLDARGLLPSPRTALYLRLQARLREQSSRIQSGEYQLLPGMTVEQAIALFASGKTITYELRIVEGWTFAQALAALRSHPQVDHQLPADAPQQAMQALGLPGVHPEGRFFPDTYRFRRGTSDLTLLRQAFQAMERVLAEEWSGRAPDLPYRTPDEALVMASIIEKETGAAFERPQIAGVFVRRLRLGMRLQTDPTVIYGLGDRFDGNLRLRDLRADTPYNTYTRGGLPPTPIALPGRAAIHAALHPDDGDAIFFVARGDGTHEFSATLAQHVSAVRRYQLKQH